MKHRELITALQTIRDMDCLNMDKAKTVLLFKAIAKAALKGAKSK